MPDLGNLVITRSRGQSVQIGEARVTVINISRNRVQFSINAPENVAILRDDAKSAEQRHKRGTQ